MIKRFLKLLSMACFAICFICACSPDKGKTDEKTPSSPKIRIVSTIYPAYDWVNQIIGKDNPHIQSSLLIDNGVERDEAGTVLQALCYILLDTEIFPE